jgi:hypothetical protein
MKKNVLQKGKKVLYFSERKVEVNYRTYKIFMSMCRISLPAFPFEFSVDKASNRMIDKRSNKGFKANSTFIYCLIFQAQKYEKKI